MGDATNLVLILGGELLKKAENLLIMGLHPSEVIKGYELASAKAQAELESTLSFFILNLPCNHFEIRRHFDPTCYSNPAEKISRLYSPICYHFYSQFLPNAVPTAMFREPRYATAF